MLVNFLKSCFLLHIKLLPLVVIFNLFLLGYLVLSKGLFLRDDLRILCEIVPKRLSLGQAEQFFSFVKLRAILANVSRLSW